MKVVNILQSKGTEVYAISDSQTLAEAVAMLADKNIGAVVVKDGGGAVAGILSERDVVRRLKSQGAAALGAPVRDCMSAKPYTCKPEDSIDDLMATMTEKRVRHLPVVSSGELVGLVSIGDVVKRKIDDIEREAAELKQYISS